MNIIVITGSSGLVRSETVDFFYKKKFKIFAIDNNFKIPVIWKNSSTIFLK